MWCIFGSQMEMKQISTRVMCNTHNYYCTTVHKKEVILTLKYVISHKQSCLKVKSISKYTWHPGKEKVLHVHFK